MIVIWFEKKEWISTISKYEFDQLKRLSPREKIYIERNELKALVALERLEFMRVVPLKTNLQLQSAS